MATCKGLVLDLQRAVTDLRQEKDDLRLRLRRSRYREKKLYHGAVAFKAMRDELNRVRAENVQLGGFRRHWAGPVLGSSSGRDQGIFRPGL